MADFINHLLQRSGVSPINQKFPLILKPRLPSLYESAQNLNRIMEPSSNESMDHRDGLGSAFDGNSETYPEHEPLWHSSTILPDRSQAIRFHQQSEMLPSQVPESMPLMQRNDRQSPAEEEYTQEYNRYPDAENLLPASEAAAPHVQTLPHAAPLLENKYSGKEDSPAPALVPAASQPQVDSLYQAPLSSFVNEHSAASPVQGNSKAPDQVDAPTRNRTIRPMTELSRRLPELEQSENRKIATKTSQLTDLKIGQIKEQEAVVHIHIGRIEVRAAPKPENSPIHRTVPAKPKMSLDDYLQGREGKQ